MHSAPLITWTDGTFIWSDICKYIRCLFHYTHEDWVNILKSPVLPLSICTFCWNNSRRSRDVQVNMEAASLLHIRTISPLTWKSNRSPQKGRCLQSGSLLRPAAKCCPRLLTEHLCAWINLDFDCKVGECCWINPCSGESIKHNESVLTESDLSHFCRFVHVDLSNFNLVLRLEEWILSQGISMSPCCLWLCTTWGPESGTRWAAWCPWCLEPQSVAF